MKIIDRFTEDNKIYTNFYKCTVEYEGLTYPSSENAFQASKIYIPGDMDKTNKLRVLAGFTKVEPNESKRIGGRHGSIELRPDWESVKDNIMYNIVKLKFNQHKELMTKLIATGDAQLVEGNYWHDNYWGRCSCERCIVRVKLNKLGKILMRIRDESIVK